MLDFPSAPNQGQTYAKGDKRWRWDGFAWLFDYDHGAEALTPVLTAIDPVAPYFNESFAIKCLGKRFTDKSQIVVRGKNALGQEVETLLPTTFISPEEIDGPPNQAMFSSSPTADFGVKTGELYTDFITMHGRDRPPITISGLVPNQTIGGPTGQVIEILVNGVGFDAAQTPQQITFNCRAANGSLETRGIVARSISATQLAFDLDQRTLSTSPYEGQVRVAQGGPPTLSNWMTLYINKTPPVVRRANAR